MIVSRNARVLFVHVQKTGGQSVEHVLRQWIPDAEKVPGLPGSKHATYAEALTAHPELADHWSFGFVRNPWARMWSWWSMIGRRGGAAERGNEWVAQRIERNPFWSGVLETCPDFEAFVMQGPERFARLRRPQVDYLSHQDRAVDFTGRTEELDAGLAVVADRLGVEHSVTEHRNRGAGGEQWREEYTPAMRDRVATLFARDLDAFGYTFD